MMRAQIRTSRDQSLSSAFSVQRMVGFLCLALGSVVLVIWGFSLQSQSPRRLVDFRTIYYNAKALLNHTDPYNALNGEQLAMYDGEKPFRSQPPLPSEITCVYPPTALLVNVPIALLPRTAAQRLWTVLNGAGLIVSGFLMWELASGIAPLLSGILIGFLLANSAGLLFQGNAAGIVVSACIIAVWCIFRHRFVSVAVLCLAVSLAIKPHDSAFVWLLILLAPKYRKNAIQVFLVAAALAVLATIWVTHVAPRWPGELNANLASVSTKGTGNDPGPTSGSNNAANSDVNLQAVFAMVKDDPDFYNRASYLVCAALLLIAAIPTWRFRMTPSRFLIALAFLANVTLLPVYHRHHDAKLLLLAVPACAEVWSRDRKLGVIGLAVTSMAIAATADLPRALLVLAQSSLSVSGSILGRVVAIFVTRPAPLFILLSAVFYLCAYWIQTGEDSALDAVETVA